MIRYAHRRITCERAEHGCPSTLVITAPATAAPADATVDGILNTLGWTVRQGTTREYHWCAGCAERGGE